MDKVCPDRITSFSRSGVREQTFTIVGDHFAAEAELGASDAARVSTEVATRLTSGPGCYSVVVADAGRLSAYTDPVGQFPLYWACIGDRVRIGPSASALAAEVGSGPDLVSLAARIACPDTPDLLADRTMYRHVRRIPDGTHFQVDDRGKRQTAHRRVRANATMSMADAAELLRVRLRASVQARVDAAGRLSTDFSGGFDSTSLAFLAANGNAPVTALTSEGMSAGSDDVARARRYARLSPSLAHHVVATPADGLPFQNLDSGDEPHATPMFLGPLRTRLAAARDAGADLHLVGRAATCCWARHPPTSPISHAKATSPHCGSTAWRGRACAPAHRTGCFAERWRWGATSRRRAMLLLARDIERGRSGGTPSWEEGWICCWRRPRADWLTARARKQLATSVRELAHHDTDSDSLGDQVTRSWLHSQALTQRAVRDAGREFGIRVHAPFLDTDVVRACLSLPAHRRADPSVHKPLPTYRELSRTAHYSVTVLSEAAGGRKLPSLAVTLAYAGACGGDPVEWRALWHETAAALATPPEPDADSAAPYLGLAAFQAADADRFFGRERLVEQLVTTLERRPFVGVFGASGSGKSSLLRAGLAARVGGIVLTPRARPVDECALRLAELTGLPAGTLKADLAADPGNLHLYLTQADVVLVVDQFEEVFTLCADAGERARFVRALVHAAEAGDRVVIGVRADFYGHCGQYPELVDALRDSQVLVGPMTVEELRQAITRLDVAADWASGHGDTLTGRERDFLTASVTAHAAEQAAAVRTTRRLRRLIGLLTVLLLVAAGAIVTAVGARQTATGERNLAIARKAVSDAAAIRAENPALSAQLSLAAYRLAAIDETRDNLLSAFAAPYASLLTGTTKDLVSLQFSPDSRLLATASWDDAATLWAVTDVHHPRRLSTIRLDEAGRNVAFHQDGSVLATVTMRSVRFWRLTDPTHPVELGAITDVAAGPTWVAFSPDGAWLATGSNDRTVRLWATTVDAVAARVCAVADPRVTEGEWQRYFPGLPYTPPC